MHGWVGVLNKTNVVQRDQTVDVSCRHTDPALSRGVQLPMNRWSSFVKVSRMATNTSDNYNSLWPLPKLITRDDGRKSLLFSANSWRLV